MIRRPVSRPLTAFAVLFLAAAAVVASTPPAAGAAPAPSAEPDPPPARAAAAADAFVADRPVSLRSGPDDGYVRGPGHASQGWQYVPYERTYRGLPVLGGDFVVVVDPGGRVSSTSVAQPATIAGLDTRATIGQAEAEKIAAGQVAGFTRVVGSRLVVDARGSSPALVWESTVEGRGAAGLSVPTVLVDAGTGAVRRVTETILNETGHAALNGGTVFVNAVPITFTNGSGNGPTTWIMGIPDGGLTCDGTAFKRVDPQPLEWGNGDPTDEETACVDAMFDSLKEMDMLDHWLGRDGLSGSGWGWPLLTDSDLVDNAFYRPGGAFLDSEVHIGRTPGGVWWTAIDVIGHENGHGIDDHTPGGVSGNGTAEFIADAFGTATEWYANEQAPYDTRDFVLIDNPAITGPYKRRMYNPHLDGRSPNCYSSAVPGMEVHDAAGVGDHWFYLLAEGSNPTDGQPASPTCNSTTLSGIGIENTMKILYNAMLMKNSSSSYLTYRTWTLTAAKNLFPGDCDLLKRVRNAWDAVMVPPQAGEPDVCVPAVTGTTQAGAVAALSSVGLGLGSVSSAASLAPAGTVIAQTPAANTVVSFGTPVNIVVSAGGVLVPNVLSTLKADAINTLQQSGLGVTTSNQQECVNPGEVFQQNPIGGAVVLPGTTVHLKIDSGTKATCGIIK